MAVGRKRLDELVTEAGERHLRSGAVEAWCDATGPEGGEAGENAAGRAWVTAEEAEVAAGQGDYRRARKLTEFGERSLQECPAWAAFREACELAERIDSFLAAVGRGAQGAGLAADCRECLDTLLVLADWCDDQGRPAAAAEARRLHALARSLP